MFDSTDLEFIKSSLILLVAGMGMTFLFLLIQIYCTNLNARVAARLAHLLPTPEPVKSSKPKAAPAATTDDGAIVAAIAASVHHSR